LRVKVYQKDAPPHPGQARADVRHASGFPGAALLDEKGNDAGFHFRMS
jgi:hypothetical protein